MRASKSRAESSDVRRTARRSDPLGVRTLVHTVSILALACLPACAAELPLLAALLLMTGGMAWIAGQRANNRALGQAYSVRRALALGQPRELERELRLELALAAGKHGVSAEREWLARFQLAGILIAEWRLDEAREVYAEVPQRMSPMLHWLTEFGRLELAVLTQTPDEATLEAIQHARGVCLQSTRAPLRARVDAVWHALEGLALTRMGRAREAIPMIERAAKEVLVLAPTRIVYLFHLAQALESIGELSAARGHYEQAARAFPGSRLANEAEARLRGLSRGRTLGFRAMLPEAPPSALGDEEPDPS